MDINHTENHSNNIIIGILYIAHHKKYIINRQQYRHIHLILHRLFNDCQRIIMSCSQRTIYELLMN